MSLRTCTWGHVARTTAPLALALGLAAPAQAHEVGLSRGTYAPRDAEVTAELTFARGDLDALLDADGDLGEHELGAAALQPVLAGLELLADDQPCPPAFTRAALVEEDGALVIARYACPHPPRRLTLRMPALATLPAGHRHLAQVVRPQHEPEDLVLHARAPEAATALLGPAPARPVAAYFLLGVEHILIGVDHLVFLLGLVIVGGRLRSLVAVVTAFTVGHSLSLALATFGWWTPSPALVEPAIALSIAYVGAENFFVADAAGRWRISLPFGFVHGFGFAGVLAGLGVAPDALGRTLLLFNLGVEAGQLLVLAPLLPLVWWLGKRSGYQRIHGPLWISGAIIAAGLFWFVERVFFGP